VEHQLTLLRWLGLPLPEIPRVSLPLHPEAVKRISERSARSDLSAGQYLLIHPTATLATKQWEEGRFAALADRLTRDSGLPIIFSAAPHESAVLRKVAAQATEDHLYWSDLGLQELFALINNCRLFIGNDSGPTHAAAALGKPIVVIWGSSDFQAWHPWDTKYELVRSDLPCMPCPGYTCTAFDQPKCILDIPVDAVLNACRTMIA
jgi:ADP-heptose:LPS heptosyltransferase